MAQAFVKSCVLRFGQPGSLLTDQGSNFESLLMKEVCALLGINKIRTSPFHPRNDGQTERANWTIKEWIAASGGPWEDELPFIVFAINSTPSAATKLSPFQLVYGRHPPMLGMPSAVRLNEVTDSPFEYVRLLRKNLQSFHRHAKVNSDASK